MIILNRSLSWVLALCRISSSVVGLISGVPTSAAPRLVLQISDLHLRRYPIHKEHPQTISRLQQKSSWATYLVLSNITRSTAKVKTKKKKGGGTNEFTSLLKANNFDCTGKITKKGKQIPYDSDNGDIYLPDKATASIGNIWADNNQNIENK